MHACPARGSFSVKKRNQKSLGEDPETPDASVRPDRKVCDLPDLGLDDAYKVFILIRFLLHPNQMRRRHLESVSSRSLSVRGSWGTAPSVFWFLLYEQKERLGGEPYRLCTLHNLRDADRRQQTFPRRVGVQAVTLR